MNNQEGDLNLSTYGFLVAIESDEAPTEEFVQDAIINLMDYEGWETSGVEVTAMGEIDRYDENGLLID